MDSSPEHDSTKTAIEGLDSDELLDWFRERPKVIKNDKLDIFREADIDGATFLKHAGDMKYFHEGCKLPIGTSERLADLAMNIVGKTANPVQSVKRKSDQEESLARARVRLNEFASPAPSSLEPSGKLLWEIVTSKRTVFNVHRHHLGS